MNTFVTLRSLRNFLADEAGATSIEYAVIAAGIAGVLIAVVMSMGTSLSTMYTSVANGFN